MSGAKIDRREWLKWVSGGVAAAMVPTAGAGLLQAAPNDGVAPAVGAGGAGGAGTARRRALRVAHLSDCHVQPERKGAKGFAACLRHVQSQADRPDFILNTGDCIMDSFRRDAARTKLQWGLWRDVLKQECSLPVEHGVGNHDIWGWDRKRSKTTGQEALWGKKRALDELGLAKSYRSFDRGGWHVIVLDSVVPFGEREYRARLDDEQFAWLEADLKALNPATPVLVASHIPIFSPAAVLNSAAESKTTPGQLASTGGGMHMDVKRIKALFEQRSNVKLCVSGHLHVIDRAEYRGVAYLSNPAVSGNWWKGKHLGAFGEMYTLLDLYDDGSFAAEYVSYGWVADAVPVDAGKEATGA